MDDLPAEPPLDDLLAGVIADALAQADALIDLDGPRAEAWASDLAALAAEAGGDDGISTLVQALASVGGAGTAAALWALDAVAGAVDLSDPALEPPPSWATSLGSSVCESAMVLRARRGESAAFRFVDVDGVRHALVVDLVPAAIDGEAEEVGEVVVGPAELLDAVEEERAGITAETSSPTELASRVGGALTATGRPRVSAVANGRLLIARLDSLGVGDLAPPVWVEDEVPDLPERDPEDDAYALDVLRRAIGHPAAPDAAAATLAATRLRDAAAADEVLAQWLAASPGPIDLDEDDLDVVLAALAAPVAPAALTPLDVDAREAVLDLEWADWLGAVIGLVREGSGASTDPEHLVDLVNRCPEVDSTIPKKDRPRVAWAFAVCTDPWAELGIADDGGLTGFGVATLPAALGRAWG